jgi:hypothetical protein
MGNGQGYPNFPFSQKYILEQDHLVDIILFISSLLKYLDCRLSQARLFIHKCYSLKGRIIDEGYTNLRLLRTDQKNVCIA